MITRYNKNFKTLAQNLRRRMTPEERKLWYHFLKELPYTVNRQKIIGNYIVDFFIAQFRLVIEIDGMQHQAPSNKEKDIQRDYELRKLGFSVVRYSNEQIQKSFHWVCVDILQRIEINPDQYFAEKKRALLDAQ